MIIEKQATYTITLSLDEMIALSKMMDESTTYRPRQEIVRETILAEGLHND